MKCNLILALVILTSGAGLAVPASDVLSERYVQLKKIERSAEETTSQYAARIRRTYQARFAHDQSRARRASAEDLEALFDAAYLVGFYTHDARYAQYALFDLNQMESLGRTCNRCYLNLYRLFVALRQFDDARRLAEQHPLDAMEALPKVINAANFGVAQRTEFRVPDDQYALLRQPARLPHTGILIVAHPYCHFSAQAAHDISADPVLGPVFRAHSKWLAPADGDFTLEAFQEWNRQYPQMRMTIAYRRADWSLVDSWDMPVFYFIRDGKLFGKLTGWSLDSTRGPMESMLRKQGLIPEGN